MMKSLLKITLAIVGMAIVACSSDTGSDLMTDRGYRYTFHRDNSGPTPEVGEYVYFHIVMRHKDSVLNTSYTMSELPRLRIPAPEEYTVETPAIVDALSIMSVGDSVTLFFPLDSLESIPPAFAEIDVIEYDMVLMEIKTDEAFKEEMQAAMQEREAAMEVSRARETEVASFANSVLDSYNKGTLENIQTTPEGLQYVIHEPGEGPKAQNGDMVAVHYYGTFTDGKMFDNSFAAGSPYSFALGQGRVIKGWDVGIPHLSKGGRASLIIPPALGYGETGYSDIPGNTTLYFYVELDGIN